MRISESREIKLKKKNEIMISMNEILHYVAYPYVYPTSPVKTNSTIKGDSVSLNPGGLHVVTS